MGGGNKQIGVVLIACMLLFLGTSTVEGIACCSGSRISCCIAMNKPSQLAGPVPATIPWLPMTPTPAPAKIPWLPLPGFTPGAAPAPAKIPWLPLPGFTPGAAPAPATIPWLPLPGFTPGAAPAPAMIPWLPIPTVPTPAPATSVTEKKVLGRKAYSIIPSIERH